jgi:hypothetical protein
LIFVMFAGVVVEVRFRLLARLSRQALPARGVDGGPQAARSYWGVDGQELVAPPVGVLE